MNIQQYPISNTEYPRMKERQERGISNIQHGMSKDEGKTGRGISNIQHGMSRDEGKTGRGISNIQHGMSKDEGKRKKEKERITEENCETGLCPCSSVFVRVCPCCP